MADLFWAKSMSSSSDVHGTTLTFRGADNATLHVVLQGDCEAALQQWLRGRSSEQDEVPPRDRFMGLPAGARRMWVDLPY